MGAHDWPRATPDSTTLIQNPEEQYSAALGLYANLEHERARSMLEEILSQHPHHFRAMLLLAKIIMLTDNTDEPNRLLTQAISSSPDNAEAHRLYGILFLKKRTPSLPQPSFSEQERWEITPRNYFQP